MSIQDWNGKLIRGDQFINHNYDQESLNHEIYPYSMVCLLVDDDIMIAVGSSPLSPKDFREENRYNSFMIDFNIPPKSLMTMQGKKTVYYASLVESSKSEEESIELDFVFYSSDHIRYHNGLHVSGPHGNAPRAIKVEANISGGDGYTVTLYNTDSEKAVIQMAPKQMKLLFADSEKIQIKGFGFDSMDESFADYGLTIYHDNGNIEKCVLHMYDRSVDIEYLQ